MSRHRTPAAVSAARNLLHGFPSMPEGPDDRATTLRVLAGVLHAHLGNTDTITLADNLRAFVIEQQQAAHNIP